MAKIDDGGPAFPTEPNTQPGFYIHQGMSLRDWLAGHALAALIANSNNSGSPTEVSELSYKIADAMLKESARG